ncbi:hypothetical protein BJ138DRAFT_61825 [Hygrophoropsis aurantiaca]|uniref:Uncharacterized protein n=1 Tax=Hygrophoropsis aurantiaca TaxID=72124 RepID=A0ACB8ACM4_9AGAM|nr:hypothetical protein BJ138DRAFT_61825 [Hygrophoropsis aurantiaca]
MSMEQLFRAGVPQTRFQTASCSDASPHTQNDSDDFVDFAPDDVIVDPTDTHLLLWSEPSDDDTDFPLFSDSEQYISESQDVLEENRSMYSLKNEFSKEQYFIHSGSSLMGSPDSSSINTPPPEISFPIRYPTNQEFLLDFALDLGPGQLRSQDCGYEEFPESSPFYASLSPFMPNDTPHDPEITSDPVHLTLDQNAIHVCSIPQDTFQPLDSPDQVSFLDAESEDSGPMLFDLDDMLCITEDSSSYLGLLQEQAEDIAYDLNTTATILATSCHTIDTFMHQVDENETGDLFFSEVLDFDD